MDSLRTRFISIPRDCSYISALSVGPSILPFFAFRFSLESFFSFEVSSGSCPFQVESLNISLYSVFLDLYFSEN